MPKVHPKRNGNLTPFDVTYVSGKKVWWICENNHEYSTRCFTKQFEETDVNTVQDLAKTKNIFPQSKFRNYDLFEQPIANI